jgi:hypothetical protein
MLGMCTASEMGGLSPATRTASEMGGLPAAIHTVSELDSLALSKRASDNFNIVVQGRQRNGNVFKGMGNALGRVFLAYFWGKWASSVGRTRGFDDSHDSRS